MWKGGNPVSLDIAGMFVYFDVWLDGYKYFISINLTTPFILLAHPDGINFKKKMEEKEGGWVGVRVEYMSS